MLELTLGIGGGILGASAIMYVFVSVMEHFNRVKLLEEDRVYWKEATEKWRKKAQGE